MTTDSHKSILHGKFSMYGITKNKHSSQHKCNSSRLRQVVSIELLV